MELRATTQLQRLAAGFDPRSVSPRRLIARLARRHPHAHLAFVAAVGMIGYGFLLSFPYLAVAMPVTLYDTLPAARTPHDWLTVTAQLILFALGAAFTRELCNVAFSPPPGRALAREEAPRLWPMLSGLHKAWGMPALHGIVLDGGPDVRIAYTPRFAVFPLFAKRTLVIGMPVLHTVSPCQLRVLIARRIAQLALRNWRPETHLHHLVDIWASYAGLRSHPRPLARVVGLAFCAYAPLYRFVSHGLARRSEIHADRSVLQIVNDRKAAEAIAFHSVAREFLERRFWPTMKRLAARRDPEGFSPYRHMSAVAARGLSGPDLTRTAARLHASDGADDGTAGLRERLESIGHAGPPPLKEARLTAAAYLMADALPGISAWFDRHWARRHAAGGSTSTVRPTRRR